MLWNGRSTGLNEEVNEPPPRIVVLPFENLGLPEDEYFADGITEEITSRLAAVSDLEVISRTSAMYYKGRNTPLRQIGDELEVEYVLEGTIRWDRNGPGHGRVRITPQLIRVANDSHLWSDRYDRVIEDIFTVQSDIAEQVLARLQTVLLEPEQRAFRAPITENIEAYQAYLLGTQYLGFGGYERNARLAVEMLERAVRMDPTFAVAHATLSEAHSNMYLLKLDFTPDRLEMAKASAERALELQPGLPEGHRALGYYHYRGFRDYDRAREEYSLALEGLPNDEITLAGVYAVNKRQGRWDEAVKHLERCARVDPKSWISATEGAVVLRLLRRYAEAETEMLRAISIAPDHIVVYYLGANNYVLWDGATDRARRLLESAPSIESARITYLAILLDLYDRAPDVGLARLEEVRLESLTYQDCFIPKKLLECMCLSEKEEMPSARAACQSAVELLEREISARPQDHRLYSALGRALALLDRPEEARRAGEYAVELMPISKDAILGQQQEIELAKIYTRIGEFDKAINMIEELLSIPSEISVPLLRLDPVWDPLRDHPRFKALLEEHGEDIQ
ncbi:MAG: tetratricopeptide repeat protein [Thermoanaerobaculales bacterium]|nr:tetratricopeptide repeat protein [Thermoanaerobaculales bacterium]